MDAERIEEQIRQAADWEVIADQVMSVIDDRVRLSHPNEAIDGFLLEDVVPRQARVLLRHLCRQQFGREVRFHSTKVDGLRLWYANIGPCVH